MSFHETCDLVRIEVDNEGTWLCCAARAVDGQENNIRFRLDDHIGNSDGETTHPTYLPIPLYLPSSFFSSLISGNGY